MNINPNRRKISKLVEKLSTSSWLIIVTSVSSLICMIKNSLTFRWRSKSVDNLLLIRKLSRLSIVSNYWEKCFGNMSSNGWGLRKSRSSTFLECQEKANKLNRQRAITWLQSDQFLSGKTTTDKSSTATFSYPECYNVQIHCWI